jgi:hypothetical protein
MAEVADRLLIQETAHRYAWAYDERRLDVLTDVFTPDVTFGFSVRGGEYIERRGRDEVVSWLHGFMKGQDIQGRHLCGNLIIEELGTEVANVNLYMVLFASGRRTYPASTGFYRMTMHKFEGRWRIARVYNGLDLQPSSLQPDQAEGGAG